MTDERDGKNNYIQKICAGGLYRAVRLFQINALLRENPVGPSQNSLPDVF